MSPIFAVDSRDTFFNALVWGEPLNSGLRNPASRDIVLWYGAKHISIS